MPHDTARWSTDCLEKIVKNLIRESRAMATVPFINKNVLSVVNKKWQTLPAGGNRNLNEGYNQVKGNTTFFCAAVS